MAKIRLHQFLSKTGAFSVKKDIVDAIKCGKITIKGKVITNPHYQVGPKDNVLFDGKELFKQKKKVYIILNKPEYYLSSKLTDYDIKERKKSVFSLLKGIKEDIKKTLFCVGRLDENSSGLLIITNDGDFSHKVTDPESKIRKSYEVELEKPISIAERQRIEQGITIVLEENGIRTNYKTKPCKIEMKDKKSLVATFTEGKKREVRRLFGAVGNRVVKLKRIVIGKLDLYKLKIPEGKYISVSEEFVKEKIE